MLLKRLRNLPSQIESLDESKKDQNMATQFTDRKKALSLLANRIKTLNETVESFIENNEIDIDFTDLNEWDQIKLSIDDIKKKFKEDHKSIIDQDKIKFDNFQKSLNSIFTKYDNRISDKWRKLALKKIENYPNERLESYSAIPQFNSSINNLRDIRKSIETISDKIPENLNESISTLQDLEKNFNDQVSQLNFDEEPVNFSNFLDKATSDGVSFSELTPEIKSFLERLELLDKLKIVLRGNHH